MTFVEVFLDVGPGEGESKCHTYQFKLLGEHDGKPVTYRALTYWKGFTENSTYTNIRVLKGDGKNSRILPDQGWSQALLGRRKVSLLFAVPRGARLSAIQYSSQTPVDLN